MKNIIFDLGGVLLNIDYNRTVEAFKQLGIEHFDKIFTQYTQDTTARQYEKGLISDSEFRDYIRKQAQLPLTENEIDTAWNAMLLDFPPERIQMLKEVGKDYNIFLLSNTNNIHYIKYQEYINKLIYPEEFNNLFKTPYYSHRVGMRKPDSDIYEMVLNRHKLIAEETLFIDDSPANLGPAKKLGMKVYELVAGKEITTIINSLLD